MQGHYRLANGTRLHYLEWGRADAPAVVLLHGASGFCHDWDLVGVDLEDRFRCVAPDIPGYGDSDWPGVGDPDGEGEVVAALMGEVGIEAAHLVGHSRSGRVATAIAARYPEMALSLTFVDASPDPPISIPPRPLGPFSSFAEALEQFGPHYPALDGAALRERVERYLKRGADGQWLVKRDLSTREVPRSDYWALLAQVRCPVLVVWASEPHVLAESVERMQQMVVGLRVVRLDCRHNVPADRPHELAQAIGEFAGARPVIDRPDGRAYIPCSERVHRERSGA